MKNKIIYIAGLFVFFFVSINCHAQLIDNRVNVVVEYFTGSFHGKELIDEKNFIYPSLYGNLNNIKGLSMKLFKKYTPHISYGICASSANAFDWNYANRTEYVDANIKVTSILPSIQYHSTFSNFGFYNRARLYGSFAPVVGFSDLTLANPLFYIQSSNNAILSPGNSTDFFYGIQSDIGLEWFVSQYVGFVVSYAYQYNRVKSILYNDNHFAFSTLKFGIVLKLKKDKYFIYK